MDKVKEALDRIHARDDSTPNCEDLDTIRDHIAALEARVAAAEAAEADFAELARAKRSVDDRLAAAEADARRYRHARDSALESVAATRGITLTEEIRHKHHAAFDAEIDAEIAALAQGADHAG